MKNILILLILFILIITLEAKDNNDRILDVPISHPLMNIDQPFDVISYELDIDFTKAPGRYIRGICHIRVYWKEEPKYNLFYFHLRGLSIDSAFYNLEPVIPVSKESDTSATYHWEISPPASATQDTADIMIYYNGSLTGAMDSFGGVHSTSSMIYTVGVGFNNNYISTAQHWMPCFDLPSDKALFRCRYQVADSMNVASVGKLFSKKQIGKDLIYDWATEYPIATYLITFAVGKMDTVDIPGYYKPIVIYTKPSDTISRTVYRKVPEMVFAFQNRFGKYPFEKVGYVNTNLSGGAMEHQTMITMSETEINNLYKQKDSVNMTAAHELSHQWFGNMVTPYDFRDAWLNESFATFAESVWWEYLYGSNAYLQYIKNKMTVYFNNVAPSEGVLPLYDFPRKSPSSNYPVTIYYKGACVVSMLRYYLGDDDFFDAIRYFLDDFAYGNATTEDLRLYIEEYLQVDLSWFFNQWIYKKGWPELNITVNKSKINLDNTYSAKVSIDQVQKADYGIYTDVPVEIGFQIKSDSTYYEILNLSKLNETFTLENLPDFNLVTINEGPSVRALFKVKSLITKVDEVVKYPVNIILYPNPASNQLNILITDMDKESQMEIFNIEGKLIDCFQINPIDGVYTNKLEINSYPAGSYLLRFSYNNYTQTLLFSIER